MKLSSSSRIPPQNSTDCTKSHGVDTPRLVLTYISVQAAGPGQESPWGFYLLAFYRESKQKNQKQKKGCFFISCLRFQIYVPLRDSKAL